MEQVAARFGLTVLDPQAEGDGLELITDANSKTLIQSWLNHNQRATLALIQDFSNPLRMSAAASLYLWRYKKAKEDLERKCGEEVFVPNLVRAGKRMVFIVGAKKGFFRAKEKQEVAVINAETLRELPVGYIQPFQWPDPSVRIIVPESAESVGKIIFSIDRTMSRSEFDVIGTDSFVDIELPNGK